MDITIWSTVRRYLNDTATIKRRVIWEILLWIKHVRGNFITVVVPTTYGMHWVDDWSERKGDENEFHVESIVTQKFSSHGKWQFTNHAIYACIIKSVISKHTPKWFYHTLLRHILTKMWIRWEVFCLEILSVSNSNKLSWLKAQMCTTQAYARIWFLAYFLLQFQKEERQERFVAIINKNLALEICANYRLIHRNGLEYMCLSTIEYFYEFSSKPIRKGFKATSE